jgi:hypothetical protein
MLRPLITYLDFGNRYCGVEHTTTGNQEILYATVLRKAQKEVRLYQSFEVSSVQKLAKLLPKNQHIALVVNNEQVLTKAVETSQGDGLKLIHKAFPNIIVSDFYFEIVQQGSTSFISICRKSYIDHLIEEYYNQKLWVISFTLGNTMLSSTMSYMDVPKIYTSNAMILHDNEVITSMNPVESTEPHSYNINGLNTTNLFVVSLSAALNGILNTYCSSHNFKEKNTNLIDNYKQHRFFNLFLRAGLVFVLGLLVINFLFFNFYFARVQVLEEASQFNQSAKSKMVRLNASVSKSQKMAEDMLRGNHSKTTFYMNALVHSLPRSILLSKMDYQPLKKHIKPDKPIELHQNTIIMSGKSNNSSEYSEWITDLERMDWIKSVEVLEYGDTKSASLFDIKIYIEHDR